MTISPQISAQSFLEKMDHENLSNTIVLTKEGYRLDDKGRGSSTLKGIRSAIGYSTLKSVDYLYETNGQAYFLEFSDLLAQYQRIMGTVKNINNSNLNTGDKLQIVKIKQGEIRKELIDKFRDTLLIITKAQKKLMQLPIIFHNEPYNLRIIIKEKSLQDPTNSRIMNQLGAELRTAIDFDSCNSIKINSLDNWAITKGYCPPLSKYNNYSILAIRPNFSLLLKI